MGGFTQSILNVLLSWLRTAITGLWDVVNSTDTQQSLEWLGQHWMIPVLLIIVAGVVIDYLVWLIRWRPFYVWSSNWRRFKRRFSREKEMAPAPKRQQHRTPAYAAPVEEIYYEEPQQTYYQPEQPYYEPSYEPEIQQAYEEVYEEPYQAPYEAAYQEPAYVPGPARGQETRAYAPVQYAAPQAAWDEEPYEEYAQYEPEPEYQQEPQQSPYMRPTSTPRRSATTRQRTSFIGNVAKNIRQNLKESAEDEEFVPYMSPKPRVDKEKAFYAPVYPPSWQEQNTQENDPDFQEE